MTDSTNHIVAANLREVADLLDLHADIKQPYITSSSNGQVSLSWYLNGDADAKAKAAAVVKAIDGGWERGEADYDGPLATWKQERGGLSLLVQVSRDDVCERIVTGTKEVTVPYVAAQPARVEVVDIVEWRCEPLLTAAVSA